MDVEGLFPPQNPNARRIIGSSRAAVPAWGFVRSGDITGPSRGNAMEENPLSPEMQRLVDKVAAWPHGIGFLHQGDLECIAVSLDVHPFVVAEARVELDSEKGRARLIREVRLARERRNAEGLVEEEAPLPCPETPRKICDVEELIRAVSSHELGPRFLTNAPLETIAVTFEVHPRTVLRAREILEKAPRKIEGEDQT